MDAISSLRSESGIGIQFSGILPRTSNGFSRFCQFSQENKSKSKLFPVLSLHINDHQPMDPTTSSSVVPTPSISESRSLKWWENSTKQNNMLEISSANQLVETLLNAGDKFYRGSEGKVCSFSCTISNINKFKKALEKHGSERCSLGPAKGLDEIMRRNLRL